MDEPPREGLLGILRSYYRPPWEMILQQWLEAVAPGPRTYARLAHHMFRICEAFTEVAGGKFFANAMPGEVHDPAEMASTAALAAYGKRVKAKVETWWAATPDKQAEAEIETYYGKQKLHEVMERATWHIGQHTRQWVMLLDLHGIAARPNDNATRAAIMTKIDDTDDIIHELRTAIFALHPVDAPPTDDGPGSDSAT